MSTEPNQVKWRGIRLIEGEPYLPVGQDDHTKAAGLKPFRNAAGTGRRMLVDDERHGQVDVQSMPVGVNLQTHPGPWEDTVAGVTRTQIIKTKTANNSTGIIYTVPAGKTLYITSSILSFRATADGRGLIFVRDENDATKYNINVMYIFNTQADVVPISYPMPIMAEADWDVVLTSGAGYAFAIIMGWLQ